jgi:hypothetical protein
MISGLSFVDTGFGVVWFRKSGPENTDLAEAHEGESFLHRTLEPDPALPGASRNGGRGREWHSVCRLVRPRTRNRSLPDSGTDNFGLRGFAVEGGLMELDGD